MIKKTRNILVGAFLAIASSASSATLVELFTSQGCSSCPRADLMLSKLESDPEVIALAYHVDYWDYLGWKDEFANPLFSARQIAYQSVRGEKQVYTPHFIVGGQFSLPGGNDKTIREGIKASSVQSTIEIDQRIKNSVAEFTLSDNGRNGKFMDVMLAYVRPIQTVEITAGENAGKLINYTNIVVELIKLGAWDGKQDLTLTAPNKDRLEKVLFVQNSGMGEVRFAVKLE